MVIICAVVDPTTDKIIGVMITKENAQKGSFYVSDASIEAMQRTRKQLVEMGRELGIDNPQERD